jgi:hypothetical protein
MAEDEIEALTRAPRLRKMRRASSYAPSVGVRLMNWLISGVLKPTYILCRQPVESRGIDPGHKFLQVFVDAIKEEKPERGKDRTCGWRRTLVFPVGRRYKG